MNFRIQLLTIGLLFLFINNCFSQNFNIPKGDFITPVEIPIYLSGTFGELRSNHFHSGIDIKTQGVEGKIIRTISDGWVSRINISTSGYGKAIYVTHSNGYMSVYGHLQRFNDTIQSIVINKQYEKESFTVQMFFEKGELPVKKGETIAYSGNTGGSNGPHLHFEIRDAKTQNPLNPLLFKSIEIKDYYRPKITKLAIYPTDKKASINGKNDTVFFDVSGWGVEHKLKGNPEINISGNVSFGIGTYDLMNDVPNKNGVYSTKMTFDTTKIFELQLNSLSFKTTRYINSLIDFSYYSKSKSRLIRTQVDTNNLLNNYIGVVGNGIINVADTLRHKISFQIADAYSNKSELNFTIKGVERNDSILNSPIYIRSSVPVNFKNKFSFKDKGVSAHFAANSFYRSFNFQYESSLKDSTSYSPTHMLHNYSIPVHKHFSLTIETDTLLTKIIGKMYVAYSSNNKDFYYLKTSSNGNKFETKTRSLGYYKVMADTIPPVIKKINFKDGKNISKQNNLKISINDKQTGIKSYYPTLNGSWILMEYDVKNSLLKYDFNSILKKGENNFKIEVTDNMDNVSEYNCIIHY